MVSSGLGGFDGLSSVNTAIH